LSVILFNAKLLALSPIKASSAPIGVAFNVCQCISVVGAFAIGLCISKSVPLYSTSTIWFMAISPDDRIVVPQSFLIVFAPSQLTFNVAVPVFARFALNVNFCPAV